MKALILIDLQNDFFPGGALAVFEADQILPVISDLLRLPFDCIIASQDWHPQDHGSFASLYGKQPGQRINLGNLEQILWPVHCVENSKGAEFVPGLDTSKIQKIVHKGTDKMVDSYSAFFDNGHIKSTGLEAYLNEKGIKDLYFAGVATEYCVKHSVIDALKLGFNSFVIIDGCRGINLSPNDSKQILSGLEKVGAVLIYSDELKSKFAAV